MPPGDRGGGDTEQLQECSSAEHAQLPAAEAMGAAESSSRMGEAAAVRNMREREAARRAARRALEERYETARLRREEEEAAAAAAAVERYWLFGWGMGGW